MLASFSITLTNIEWRVYLERLDQRDCQGGRLGRIGAYLDPMAHLGLFLSEDVNNYASFYNARYDEIIRTLAPQSTSRDQRLALLREAETLLLEQAPIMPIFSYNDRLLSKDNVTGKTPNPLNYFNYKFIALTKPK